MDMFQIYSVTNNLPTPSYEAVRRYAASHGINLKSSPSSSSMSIDSATSRMSPHESLMRLAASQGFYPKSSSSMSVDTPYQKSSMSVDTPRSAAYIEQYPQIPEFSPISQPKLELTQNFLQSLADYQNEEAERRKEKMERMDIDEPIIFEKPAGVETGRGKKVAMSKEALGKEADTRGIPFKKAEKTGKVPKPKKGASRAAPYKVPVKSRVEKKKKQPEKEFKYQPVTERNTNALLKRLGSKIAQRFKAMKKDDVQYEVTKAAYEKWLKKK
jgi:hypothetical protein